MFKNNKENVNYMSKEEVEQLYESYKKNFDSKIEEQKNKISDLADSVSARFGEDVLASNVNATIKILENSIKDIEKLYKIDLEATKRLLKKEIDKAGKKLNEDFEQAIQKQVTNYNTTNSILNQNAKEIEKINELLSEKDSQILELSNEFKDFINGDLEYKKDIEDRFENTNKKINKINYHGITNKFDKKLQEESDELNKKINVLNIISNENSDMIADLANKILETNKWATNDITENKKNIDTINEKYLILNENINDNNKKTIEIINPIKEKQEKLQQLIDEGNVKSIEEINILKGLVEHNKTEVFKLIKKLQNDLDKKLNEELLVLKNVQESNEETIKKLDSKIIAEIEVVNEGVKANKNIIKEINKVVKADIEEMSNKIQYSKQEICNITTKFDKDIEQLKQDTNNIFEKFDITANENNKNINIKLDELSQKLESSKLEIDNIKVDVIANTEIIKQNIINDNKKFERHLSEQINLNDVQNKENFKQIEEIIENMQNSINNTINKIGQDILKLKEESASKIEKTNENENIEQLKKEHEQYVLEVNNELNKINQSILNAQKKNLESNNNLQVKIKAYIDSKIEKISGVNNVEDVINELQLSILEREKLHKAEMEKLFKKRLKEIEKENERILKKKIDELNNYFITNKTMYKEEKQEVLPRNKKNMYELIDTKQSFKRSAASKSNPENTNEGKTQILKFFYDDDVN